MWSEVFVAIGAVGGLGSLATLFYIVPTSRKIKADARKTGIEADDILVGRALEMYQEAKKESLEAKEEAKEARLIASRCRIEVLSQNDHIDHLERLMRDAGLNPPKYVSPTEGLGI